MYYTSAEEKRGEPARLSARLPIPSRCIVEPLVWVSHVHTSISNDAAKVLKNINITTMVT